MAQEEIRFILMKQNKKGTMEVLRSTPDMFTMPWIQRLISGDLSISKKSTDPI